MKLLSKSQIAVENSLVKKQQIDEGVQLAKKIVLLRAELLNLEKSRNNFIEGNKREIDIQLKEGYEKLDNLKNELVVLEDKKKDLKKPLDEEWDKLNEKKEIFKKEQNLLKERQTVLEDKEFNLNNKESEIKNKEEKIDLLLKETRENFEKSKNDKNEAEIILIKSKTKVQNIDDQIAERLKEIEKQEAFNKHNRLGNEQVKKNNELREKTLNDRERQINDKYATFERNLKRNNG